MHILTKKEIKDENIIIPINTKGYVKAIQWNGNDEKYIVDFQKEYLILVNKNDVIVVKEGVTIIEQKRKVYIN